MTKEQQEAVEMLIFIKEHNTLIGFKKGYREEIAQTLINLIQEQQDTILQQEFVINEIGEEIEKKDEIIDKMADCISSNLRMDECSDCCEITQIKLDKCNFMCNECLKQYFERKVEKC